MTWIDGLLIGLLAVAAASVFSCYREAAAAREARARAEDDLIREREAREADRAAFAAEREVYLYDHRQLVSRRLLVEGVPPLDEPLRNDDEPAEEYDEETEEGLQHALDDLGGGRRRGTGRIASVREEYDRLETKLEEVRQRKKNAGTPRRSPVEPDSPYEPGERPLTADDFAAIDEAAHPS